MQMCSVPSLCQRQLRPFESKQNFLKIQGSKYFHLKCFIHIFILKKVARLVLADKNLFFQNESLYHSWKKKGCGPKSGISVSFSQQHNDNDSTR